MKIAIITFSDFNTNYGSILQSYALKMFCESLGHEVTNIRYREFNEIRLSHIDTLKAHIRRLYNIILYKNRLQKRYANFQCFITRHIEHTKLYTSEDSLEREMQTFDAYICGSDQIWNLPILGGLREPYFLKFAPGGKLKIAYAPSMGEYMLDDGNREKVIELLKSFSAISTREVKSSLQLSSLLNRKVYHVADPTLLIGAELWKSSVSDTPVPKNDYGVCYFVRRNKLGDYLVKLLKRKYRIPIYNISDGSINVPLTSNKYVSEGPDAFVSLIANAKFCVGTSFHLAVFSVIFKKECYIAGSAHNKERVSNLFQKVGREKFLLFSKEESRKIISSDYNGTSGTDQLNKFISSSQKFLIESLNE